MAKSGYCNGNDVLMSVDGKCFGHCTTHQLVCDAETKSRAVKPVLTASIDDGLWDETSIIKLSMSASASGLCFYGETESSYAKLLSLITAAKPIEVKFFERNENGGSTTPAAYCTGNFVITNVTKDAPSGDDVSYSVSLKSTGKPTIDLTKLTPGVPATAGA